MGLWKTHGYNKRMEEAPTRAEKNRVYSEYTAAVRANDLMREEEKTKKPKPHRKKQKERKQNTPNPLGFLAYNSYSGGRDIRRFRF